MPPKKEDYYYDGFKVSGNRGLHTLVVAHPEHKAAFHIVGVSLSIKEQTAAEDFEAAGINGSYMIKVKLRDLLSMGIEFPILAGVGTGVAYE